MTRTSMIKITTITTIPTKQIFIFGQSKRNQASNIEPELKYLGWRIQNKFCINLQSPKTNQNDKHLSVEDHHMREDKTSVQTKEFIRHELKSNKIKTHRNTQFNWRNSSKQATALTWRASIISQNSRKVIIIQINITIWKNLNHKIHFMIGTYISTYFQQNSQLASDSCDEQVK